MKAKEPVPAAVVVQPAEAKVRPGKRVHFTAQVVDRHGRPLPGDVSWESADCQVDTTGTVLAPAQEGSYTVTARYQGLAGTAQLVVAAQGDRALAQPLMPLPAHGLVWQGQLPAEKWVDFYTQVLAAYAAAKGLKLAVYFQVGEHVSAKKVAETRAALRELGLDDTGLKVVEE